jgi:NAD(P)-dependent dehydrogenase (short-subunit alcohol dehydrogenase family)
VNCVAPGAIETERTKREAANYAVEWGKLAPAGRVGTPEDIGRAVVFLASGASSFMTGHTMTVDGGLFCQSAWIAERP